MDTKVPVFSSPHLMMGKVTLCIRLLSMLTWGNHVFQPWNSTQHGERADIFVIPRRIVYACYLPKKTLMRMKLIWPVFDLIGTYCIPYLGLR